MAKDVRLQNLRDEENVYRVITMARGRVFQTNEKWIKDMITACQMKTQPKNVYKALQRLIKKDRVRVYHRTGEKIYILRDLSKYIR